MVKDSKNEFDFNSKKSPHNYRFGGYTFVMQLTTTGKWRLVDNNYLPVGVEEYDTKEELYNA